MYISASIALLLVAPVISVPVHHTKTQLRNDDLESREPRWGNWFNDVNDKLAVPAAKVAAGLVFRDEVDELELSIRDFDPFLENLVVRDPNFGSWFRKAKTFVNGKNVKKAAKLASWFIREDGEIFDGVERDLIGGAELPDDLD